ncbi:MAG: multidrug effflux MFS transporter [Dehalococcoidia bacterium]|nr:multidrug effflux MFS transporter [Dehalococcoidia bacterium]
MSSRITDASTCQTSQEAVRSIGIGRITAILAAVAAVGQVSTTIYLPSIPMMAVQLGTPESLVQLTIVAYLVPFALFQLLAGPVSDSRGRRVTLAWGLGLFILGSGLGALSWNVPILFVARFLQGVGASAGYSVSRAVARDLFEGSDLTRVIGDIALIFALAPGCMPLVGGIANDVLGWRANFAIPVVFGLAILTAVLVFLPETLRSRTRLDVARLAGVVYMPIARSAHFLSFALLSTVPFTGLFAFFAAGPAYTINVVGLTPMQFGMLPPIAVSGVLVGLKLSRRMLRRSRAGQVITLGIVVGLVAAGLILSLHRFGLLDAAALTAGMFIHGVGLGIIVPVTSAEAIRPFGSSAGAASALLGFIQMTGAILGTLVTSQLGTLLGRYAFPEVMLAGALLGCLVLWLSRRVIFEDLYAGAIRRTD